MLFYVDVGYPHQVLDKHRVLGQLITSRLFRIVRDQTRELADLYPPSFFFPILRDVLRPVRARVSLQFVGVPSAARNPLRHERHREHRGERPGETGEDVLQTGRVQAGKPGDIEQSCQGIFPQIGILSIVTITGDFWGRIKIL